MPSLLQVGMRVWSVHQAARISALKALYMVCPAVAYGPSNSGMDHAANEYIGREEMKRAKSVLLKFLSGRAQRQKDCHPAMECAVHPI